MRPMSVRDRSLMPLFLVLAAGAGLACGERADVWNDPIRIGARHGLVDAVAVVDESAKRVVLAVPEPDLGLARSSVAVGPNVVATALSRDRTTLFVLSAGDQPRREEKDARPSLTVIRRSGGATIHRTFALKNAQSALTLDPLGRYVALHAAPAGTANLKASFVENPNEVVVLDLDDPSTDSAATSRTLRSFGGTPRRFTFTPPLSLPGGSRRLLIAETEQDVALLDLDHLKDKPERPEITVRLGSGSTSKVLKPAGLVFDDGEPTRNDDTRIAIRSEGDSSVVTLTLGPATAAAAGTTPPPNANDFSPTVNLVDVGGPPSDLAFVRTDGGLRLAAIVPGISSAVLVEPETGVTDKVTLPAPFTRVSLVTRDVASVAAPAASSDVALLWGGSGAGVAFWSLGRTSGVPYRSVEFVSVGGAVASVKDVPPPRPELKVLELGRGTSAASGAAGTASFAILNLKDRTASPLVSTANALSLEVSSDGARAWAFQPGTGKLAAIGLADARPQTLDVERNIDAVYDIEAPGGRALVAVHARGAVGLTLLDALTPDPARTVAYSGLLLEGVQ